MRQERDTAKDIVTLLDASTQQLDTQIVSRLKQARHTAVARAQATGPMLAGHAGLLQGFLDYLAHHRMVMPVAMMCGAVMLAFVVTQQFVGQDGYEQGDAFLLASDLPPEAYLDKGFDEWLERTSEF